MQGVPVSSEQRAETFAEHLEAIQWRVRPVSLLPDMSGRLSPPLAAREDDFSEAELAQAIRKMKNGKASQKHDAPTEALKAFEFMRGAAFQWLQTYCNLCWATKTVPREWALASVVMLYKKGNPELLENCKPISLLNSIYKIYAAIITKRLEAGIEKEI